MDGGRGGSTLHDTGGAPRSHLEESPAAGERDSNQGHVPIKQYWGAISNGAARRNGGGTLVPTVLLYLKGFYLSIGGQ